MGSIASTMPSRNFGPWPGAAKIWNLRLLVQLGANAVPDELAHHAKAVGFHVLLHRRAHIADRVADPRLLDALVQRSLGHFQQLPQLRLSDRPPAP